MLLAIDTATHALGLGLHSGTQVIAETVWHSDRRHTIELAPEAALALRRANLTAKSLTALAVALGPGSYSGLRIGMALAKGLALAHQLPIVGIPTLEILAQGQAERPEPMLALLQAGRGRLAAVWYKWNRKGWKARGAPQTLTWQQILEQLEEPTFICGEIDQQGREALRGQNLAILASPSQCVRRPSTLAELAWKQLRSGATLEPASIHPVYLPSEASGSR